VGLVMINHGSTEYWLSYAEEIVNRTKINQPWMSEIKCAEIGLGQAVKEGNPKALELKHLLWMKKRKNDFKIAEDNVNDTDRKSRRFSKSSYK
jgi:hypothetical protein